jgi:type II secretory pathway component PulM
MPALPLDEAGKYVAAAYVVFLLLVLIYVAIMAARLARVERDLAELAELARETEEERAASKTEGGSGAGSSNPKATVKERV